MGREEVMEKRIVDVKQTGEHVVRYKSTRRRFYKSVLDQAPINGRVRISKRKFERHTDAENYHFRFWARLRRLFVGSD